MGSVDDLDEGGVEDFDEDLVWRGSVRKTYGKGSK